MKRMTPAELHKLLTEAIMGAHQELSRSPSHDDLHVRRAHEILTSVMDRIIFAAHHAHPERADISAAIPRHDPHRPLAEACPCHCHADNLGRRDWPLLTDTLGEITACSRCRDAHRVAPPQDSAA